MDRRYVPDCLAALIRFQVIATAFVGAGSGLAVAEGIQFQCGASEGYSHFSDQGLAAGQGGWDQDGIADGETVIRIDLDTGIPIVRFKDASGDWSDVTDVGGSTELWYVQEEPMSFGVMVRYIGSGGASIEVSTLSEIDFDKRIARLTTTQARVSELFTNSRVLTSECRVSAF